MKKAIGILLAIVMVVFSAGSGVYAETVSGGGSVDSGKSDNNVDTANATHFQIGGVNFGLGVKAWYNQYDVQVTLSGDDEDDFDDETSSELNDFADSGLVAGPSLQLSYKKFFGGISYLMSLSDYENSDGDSFERKDLDLVTGYMVHDRLGVLIGYKNVDLEYSDGTNGERSGLAVGAAFNYPVQIAPKNTLVLTLNGTLFPSLKIKEDPIDTNGIGFSVELGAAYPIANWVFSLGVKMQYFEFEQDFEGEDNWGDSVTIHADFEEVYSGLILNAIYRF